LIKPRHCALRLGFSLSIETQRDLALQAAEAVGFLIRSENPIAWEGAGAAISRHPLPEHPQICARFFVGNSGG
jgi:hypothetical protein